MISNRETLLLIRRSFILCPPVQDDDRERRYLLRRTDQDSIHVPVHFETVCQSRDSNATLWSVAMDLRLFSRPRQFRDPSCQSKRSNLFFIPPSFRDLARFLLRTRNEISFFPPGKKVAQEGAMDEKKRKKNNGRRMMSGEFRMARLIPPVCFVRVKRAMLTQHFHIPIILQKGWLKFQRTFLLPVHRR